VQVLDWHRQNFERLAAAKAELPHALLLRGRRGIGKFIFARALAQALLCEAPTAKDAACGQCSACIWFAAGSHPDYRQIEPGGDAEDSEAEEGAKKKPTTISVDQIRALADFTNISSHRGGPKVIVISPAEALNVNAANALLKTLEEPPPRTYLLLVTHRPHQLLPTIKSRCQQLPLQGPDAASAVAWLAAQGVRQPELALAHTGDAPLLAVELAGTEYWGARTAFLHQLAAQEIDVFAAAEAVHDFPVPHVIACLQKWSYDMVHYRALGRVRYNPDCVDAIGVAAQRANPLAALRFHREMVRLQRIAQHPLNPRLFIEHLLLAYRDLMQPAAVAA
jgi:DNA polymerase-3 subunit delta'